MTIVWSASQRGQYTGIAVAGPSIPDPSSLLSVACSRRPTLAQSRRNNGPCGHRRTGPTSGTRPAPPPCAAAKPTAQPRIHAEAHRAGFAPQPPDQDPPSIVQACAFEAAENTAADASSPATRAVTPASGAGNQHDGPPPVALPAVDLLPYDEYAQSLNRKRASAGVLFRDEQRRVLLVQTSYKVDWDIPGGAVEAGEAPWVTARREVREELGIDRPLGQLLVIDYVPDDGLMPEGLAFVWDGGILTQSDRDLVILTDPEIVAVEFRAVTDVVGRVKPRLERRLRAALEARGRPGCAARRGVATARAGWARRVRAAARDHDERQHSWAPRLRRGCRDRDAAGT